jgi:hypothetical protein
VKGLLIEQDPGSPALGLQGIVGLHLTQVNWYGIVQEDLFDNIELLDYLFHPSLMLICSCIVFEVILYGSIADLCHWISNQVGRIGKVEAGFLCIHEVGTAINHAFHSFHHV